ncbi:hypothetical protein HMPREF9701_00452 [Delftia acidovorans CCUG 274B]|uniref:hypothetical protein n=1 Tax=Delftia acidovorans TaxID=80866 RepID=UPI000353F299|nr:hypothetical protein [Delftia acidovorans]EPD44863.1 hypothetical protein HMPREF9701_00452 [Delftia acidovorans CCUG 274B]
MESKVFDVSLYWHTGGSVFLGTVASMGVEQAKDDALDRYMSANKKQKKEIEEGGGFSLEADMLPPSEAARWVARNT